MTIQVRSSHLNNSIRLKDFMFDFNWILNFIQRLYKVHIKTECPVQAEYFRKFAFFSEVLFIFLMVFYTYTGLAFVLLPIYMYFVIGKLIPCFPLYVPFVDENTIIGYVELSFFHLLIFCLAITSYAAFEYLIAIMIVSSLMFAKLISMDAQQMNEELHDGAIEHAKG